MNNVPLLEWSAPEFIYRKKTPDWYWAIGITTIAGTIASYLYSNYLFSIFILLGGISLFYFGTRQPEVFHYSIFENGIKIGQVLYLFENLRGFSMHEVNGQIKLILVTERIFLPLVILHVPEEHAHETHDILSHELEEGEFEEPALYRLLEKLGF